MQLCGLRRTKLAIAASPSIIQHWLISRLAMNLKPCVMPQLGHADETLDFTFSTMVIEADYK